MAEDAITEIDQLLAAIRDLKARADRSRPPLLWAATVEIRGKLCQGLIVELTPRGGRLRFAAEAQSADELMSVIAQFDGFGAKVLWQYEGEAGLHFLAAPEEIAARVRGSAAKAAPATLPGKPKLAPAAL